MTEDLSTYTEVDPNSHISATSSRATGTTVNRNETCYLYKDYGANCFNGLSANFDIRVTTFPSAGIMGVFGLSNTLGHIGVWGTNEPRVVFYNNVGAPRLYFVAISGTPYYAIAANITYYCTFVRFPDADTIVLYVYSDAARTTLLTTLSNTVESTTKWQYVFGISSQNTAAGYATSGYIENLSIARRAGIVHRSGQSFKGLIGR